MTDLLGVAAKLYKDQYNKVIVATREDNQITLHIEDKNIGFVRLIDNYSNCGVLDLHNLSSSTKSSQSIILNYMSIYCRVNGQSILTYSTSASQKMVKQSLEKNGFHTVGKTFYNRSSSHDIEFHLKEVD